MNDQQASTPQTTPSLHSTFAVQLLKKMAARVSEQHFAVLLQSSIGTGHAQSDFLELRTALAQDTLVAPRYRVSAESPPVATYEPTEDVIVVSRQAIDKALEQPEASFNLLMALIEAFASYLDNLLRRPAADRSAEDAPTLATHLAQDAQVRFARTLLFYNDPVGVGTVFATYARSANDDPVQVCLAAPEPSVAAQQDSGADEEQHQRKKRFAAGHGDEHAHASFGHASITDTLKEVGFDQAQCRAIYFGNWLRDYSQLIDPKIVRPAQDTVLDAENLQRLLEGGLPRLPRARLTAVVDLLALKAFHDLQRTPQAREAYRVTPQMLGVYCAHEHMDNPVTLDSNAIDPRKIDPAFAPLMLPGDPRNSLLPKRSMKRYLRRSMAYMQKKLLAARKDGPTPAGMRYFGEALHVLEDYFAHSNFVELCLKRIGHDEILTWTTKIESRARSKHEWPLVTGMFGTLDVVSSVLDPLAKHLYPGAIQSTKALKPGERDAFDEIMLILLEDQQLPWLRGSYEVYLNARDQLAENWIYQLYASVRNTVEVPVNILQYAGGLIRKPLLKWAGDHIATLQVHLDEDPNHDPEAHVTHSQLSKDHDTHPFHTLAVELARLAVGQVGQAMFDHWSKGGEGADDPAELAKRFIVHPNDSDWWLAPVTRWAREHPEQVEQGKSIEALRALQSAELDKVRQELAQALETTERHIEQIEQLTGVSFLEVTYGADIGPIPI